jgi:regulator of RNase E activity RraA
MKRTVATVALLFLCACVYSQVGNRFNIDKADQLQPGISTVADAKALLGEPVTVQTNPENNHQLLIWQYAYGTAIAVGGGAKLGIAFDENGKMIKIIQRTKV